MAGDGDQRPFQPPRHVFDKPCLATTGRAFQDYRQVRGVCRREQVDLMIDGQVIRLVGDSVFFDGAFRHVMSLSSSIRILST